MGDADWAAQNVPAMWNSAQAADTQMAWQQVGAWSRTHDLLLHHELRLKALKEELSRAWPTDRSPAAQAFADYIGAFLTTIGRAREDAGRNTVALTALLDSLVSAKKDMAQLKEQWDEYEAESANRAKNLSNVTPHSGGSNWQEELNAKGRARMTRSDQEVLEATRQMVELSPAGHAVEKEGREPFNPESAGASGSESEHFGGFPPLASPLLLGAPVGSETERKFGASGTDLELAGSIGAISPPAGDTELRPGGGPSARPADTARPILDIPPGQGSRSSAPTSSTRHSGAGRTPPHAVGTSRLPHPNGQASTAHPSGGLLGRSAGARVNPVGGVIGGQGVAPLAGIPASATRGPSSDVSRREPTAIMSWEVPVGGPAVIQPSTERPFKLGPGVIGADR